MGIGDKVLQNSTVVFHKRNRKIEIILQDYNAITATYKHIKNVEFTQDGKLTFNLHIPFFKEENTTPPTEENTTPPLKLGWNTPLKCALDVKKVAIREKKRVKLTEEEDIFGTDIQEYFRNVEIDFTDKRPPCSNHEGDEGFQLTCPECKTAAGIETSSRRLQSKPAPSSRYSLIAIFVCAMVIIALIILMLLLLRLCF